jgi:hypothetical protein
MEKGQTFGVYAILSPPGLGVHKELGLLIMLRCHCADALGDHVIHRTVELAVAPLEAGLYHLFQMLGGFGSQAGDFPPS